MSILEDIKEAMRDSMIVLDNADYNRLPDDLRNELKKIEQQYQSDPFSTVQFDMPETLGLEKLSHETKSDDELYELAKKTLAASYQSSVEKLESDYTKNSGDIELKKVTEAQGLASKLTDAEEEAKKLISSTENDTLKRGLARSSIREQSIDDIKSGAEDEKNKYASESANKTANFDKQISNLQEQKLTALQNLDVEHALKLDNQITALLKQEQAAQEAVLKYNNTVDEKEANYQKTRQSAYDAAIKAQYEAEKQKQQLAANLGQDTLTDLQQQSKLEVVREYIAQSGMSSADALKFISQDMTFKKELGSKYYAQLENWLKGYML